MFLRRLSFLGIESLLLIFINNYWIIVDANRWDMSRGVMNELEEMIEGTMPQVDTNTNRIPELEHRQFKLEEKISEFQNVLKQFQKTFSECSVNKIATDLSHSYRSSERMVDDVKEREREFEMVSAQSPEGEDLNCLVKLFKTQLELKSKLKDEQQYRKSLEDRIRAMEAKMKNTRLELQIVKRKSEENEDGLLNLSDGVNVKSSEVGKAFDEMQISVGSRVTVIEEKLKTFDAKQNDCDIINPCLLIESPRNATLRRNLRKGLSKTLYGKFRRLEENLNETQVFTQKAMEKAVESDRRITNLLKKYNENSTAVTAGLNESIIEERFKQLETKFLDCDSFSECLLSIYPVKVGSTGNSSLLTKNKFFTEKVLTCRQERNEMQDMLQKDIFSAVPAHFDDVFDDLGSCLFSIKLLNAFKTQNKTLHSDLSSINSEMGKIIEEMPKLRSINSNLESKYENVKIDAESMATNISANFESASRFQGIVNTQFRKISSLFEIFRTEINRITSAIRNIASNKEKANEYYPRRVNDINDNGPGTYILENFENNLQSSNVEEYLKSLMTGVVLETIYPTNPANNREVAQRK